MFCHTSHRDDSDADPDSSDDVQLVVEDAVDGGGAALSRHTALKQLGFIKHVLSLRLGKIQANLLCVCVCVWMLCYRGDEDVQPLLLGTDVVGAIKDRPCWTAAVQLQRRSRRYDQPE